MSNIEAVRNNSSSSEDALLTGDPEQIVDISDDWRENIRLWGEVGKLEDAIYMYVVVDAGDPLDEPEPVFIFRGDDQGRIEKSLGRCCFFLYETHL